MNTHAISQNERGIRIIQNIIKKYNILSGGVRFPVCDQDSRTLAEHISRSLKRNGLMKTYGG